MIGILIFPGFQLLDAAGPISVFEIAGRYVPSPHEICVLAVNPGPVCSSSGTKMLARDLPPEDSVTTLVVAGGEGVEGAAGCPTTLSFIQGLAGRGVRVASVCSGAYLLAEAGLLDGRRATTHWCRTHDFIARYPNVKLQPDRIFTRDDNIWTSAGITAGIDLALAIVAEDYKNAVAHETARQLVLFHRRSGGQLQSSQLLELNKHNGRFGPLLSWVRQNLDHLLTAEMLAERAGMSSRHFARAFTAETGLTPSKAVERLRVEAARERIQCSSEPIEHVAQKVGFSDPERMRRAFIRAFGQPPQSMRRVARTL